MEGEKYTGKLYSFSAGFIFSAILFGSLWVSYNLALAAWQEPSVTAPGNNIAQPLNSGDINQSKIGGLAIGGVVSTSELCFGVIGDDCRSSWNDVLGAWTLDTNGIYYSGGNVAVGPAFTGSPTWPLSWARLAISMGAIDDREGLYITRDIASNYSYLNIENETGSPIFRVHQTGRVGIGTTAPNSDLHINNATGNAEISIQSVPGVNEHWGIYHDGVGGGATNELRFWKGGANRVKFASDGVVTATDFCLPSGECFSVGGGATYIGSTTGVHNGDQGGYTNANTLCNADFTDSHVCTSEEILRTINTGGSLPLSIAWIMNGPPGYTANANDCQGRTSSLSGSDYGAIWLPSSPSYPDGVGALSQCSSTYKLACCK